MRFLLRLRRPVPSTVARDDPGVAPLRRRSPVGFGAGGVEAAPQHRCAPVERAPTEAFRPRMLLVATAIVAVAGASDHGQDLVSGDAPRHRLRDPEHLPPLSPERAPSSPPPRCSSRHSYAGFATSAELPTCLHAVRSRARSSSRATSPPRARKAACRPSTSTNLDDPRAHPRTLATSASGLASHLLPSDPLA